MKISQPKYPILIATPARQPLLIHTFSQDGAKRMKKKPDVHIDQQYRYYRGMKQNNRWNIGFIAFLQLQWDIDSV